MLQKFLFIGLGGSGGKTLRMLHHNLRARLREEGYQGSLPGGWQFLHVDVPVTPDGSSPDLPAQLPQSCYVGMAPRGLNYRNLDAMIENKGRPAHEHSKGWRPDANQVMVSPAYGAGQYRAVGRTITGAALGTVVDALRKSALALTDVAVDQELDRVSLALTRSPGVSPHAPQVVVVSSIAGGSGAGAFLDVCDAVRQLMPMSREQIAAVLFTPDVFADLPPASRSGVNANGLAAICELLASYWNNEPPTEGEFAFLNAAGLSVHDVVQRGPSMTFLVGRSNGEIAFTDQTQVYRAVARSLTAWTADQAVQDAIHSTVIGNWSAKASRPVDRSGLAPGRPAPFSSFGYASVDLGRSRFSQYATERLARAAANQVLRGHWNEQVPHEITPEAASEQAAQDQWLHFVEGSGLRELGTEYNQIIDAIRGGMEHNARAAKLSALRQEITRAVAGSGQSELSVHTLMQRIESRIAEEWHHVLDAEYEQDKERARAWHLERQRVIAAQAADLLGRVGGDTAARVLELAIKDLTTAVVPELNRMADTNRRIVGTMPQRIHSVFASFTGQLMSDNPLISKGVQEAVQSIHAEAEARLYELSVRLIVDLADNFLEPLRLEMLRATSQLETAATGRPGTPSVVDAWPVEAPSADLAPAQNELLLEPVDSYPDTFLRCIAQTVGMPDVQGALLEAVRQVIVGGDEAGEQSAVECTRAWVPSQQVLRTMGTPHSARFALHVSPEELLDRAHDWVHRRNSAIGEYVAESFEHYLAGATTGPAEQDRRLQAFGGALRQALATSRPLVQLDPAANAHFHGVEERGALNVVITPLPFPAGHPARKVVAEVLYDRSEAELERLYDDSNRQRVDITTFLDAPSQPVVFQSLTGPIANEWAQRQVQPDLGGFWQWRRARPLPACVPTAPSMRRAMIRGWFIGRALNHLDVANLPSKPVTVVMEDGTPARFPHPLLGLPIGRLDDVLPAVLESMGIAMVAAPQHALRAYTRLYELGIAKGGTAGSGLAPALNAWIARGAVSRGAAAPDESRAGTADGKRAERADALLGYLAESIEHYQQMVQLDFTDRAVQLPRAWEIAREVVAELVSLQDLIVAARQEVDFSNAIG